MVFNYYFRLFYEMNMNNDVYEELMELDYRVFDRFTEIRENLYEKGLENLGDIKHITFNYSFDGDHHLGIEASDYLGRQYSTETVFEDLSEEGFEEVYDMLSELAIEEFQTPSITRKDEYMA